MGEKFGRLKGAIVVDYRGLTVADLTSLRRELRAVNGDMKVVKNRLCLRAIKDFPTDKLVAHFQGPTAVVFGFGDPVPPAKILKTFMKTNEKLKIKIGMLPGSILSSKEVEELASLASREELLANLLGVMKEVSAKFVRTLHAVPQNFVQVLEAYRQKREKGN